jgi:rusticyanin
MYIHPRLLLLAAVSVGAAVAIAAIAASAVPDPPTAAGPNLSAIIGRALAHRPTPHESLATAEAQADTVPAGALVNAMHRTVSFTGAHAALTIVASPPNGRDMAFRAAGLENPTIEVNRGAVVTIRFVNGDSDTAHGWMLLEPVVEVRGTTHGPRAFPGAFAPLLGDPTAAGQPLETVSFTATTPGSYVYECPVPGHAAMGMRGTFVVTD